MLLMTAFPFPRDILSAFFPATFHIRRTMNLQYCYFVERQKGYQQLFLTFAEQRFVQMCCDGFRKGPVPIGLLGFSLKNQASFKRLA